MGFDLNKPLESQEIVTEREQARECKFWLESVALARNRGIPAHDIREIERLVFAHKESFLKKYHEYHSR
jgi:Domain of unknown function (DUF4160)